MGTQKPSALKRMLEQVVCGESLEDRGYWSYHLLIEQFCITTLMSGYTFYLYLYANTVHRKLCIVQHIDYIYPAKITIIEAKDKRANRFYMVITVGMIDIDNKVKETLTNTRVHPETGESLPVGEGFFCNEYTNIYSQFQ